MIGDILGVASLSSWVLSGQVRREMPKPPLEAFSKNLPNIPVRPFLTFPVPTCPNWSAVRIIFDGCRSKVIPTARMENSHVGLRTTVEKPASF